MNIIIIFFLLPEIEKKKKSCRLTQSIFIFIFIFLTIIFIFNFIGQPKKRNEIKAIGQTQKSILFHKSKPEIGQQPRKRNEIKAIEKLSKNPNIRFRFRSISLSTL